MKNTKETKRVRLGQKLLADYYTARDLRKEGFDDETICLVLGRDRNYLKKIMATFGTC